ncbi:kinase-like domain-containing protein [Mycena filopes]|nr:kinase-like domain-containing protein [Mycena filopes]
MASTKFLLEWDPILASAMTQNPDLSRDPALITFAETVQLAALQEQASKAMGKTCTGAHLFAVGGYNAVYLLPFNDGTDILARLRIPGGGQAENGRGMTAEHLSARFSSEVATLRFLKAHAPSIPVPDVYAWDGDDANPVGAPYMLMERISGVLYKGRCDAAGRAHIAAQVAAYETELRNLPLSSIGCLVDAAGTVGPLVRTCAFGLMPNDRGPFKTSKEFLLACVGIQLDLLAVGDDWTAERTACSDFNGGAGALSREYAARWFSLLRDAIAALPDDPPATTFRLAHTDFNQGNMLMSSAEKDATIVAVLDWEGAQVLPSWHAAAPLPLGWLVQEADHAAEDNAAEGEELMDIYDAIVGDEPLQALPLATTVLQLLERCSSVTLDRQRLDALFLDWFAQVSNIVATSELDPFYPLKAFIESDGAELT